MRSWIVAGMLLWGTWAAGDEKAPVTIADFEEAESLELWNGLPRTQTDAHASSGRHGMAFSVPAYKKGDEERPGVALPVKGWPGSPGNDLSGYGGIAVDVWVEGEEPGKLGLKLRDAAGESSWTTHITVEPGKWNTAELSMADASADCDIKNVSEVVLYALRPETAFTLIVDNLRLLPAPIPPVAKFSLVRPNYRGLVWPEQRSIAATVELALEPHGLSKEDVALEGTARGGRVTMRMKRTGWKDGNRLAIPADELPEGPASFHVSLVNKETGETLAEQEWSLRKVSEDEKAGLKAYVDANQNLVVDGEPFFPLGWYTNTKTEYLDEIADSPFNCLLAYGTNHVKKERMLAFMDRMQEKGLKLIYCLNDVYPTATYFEGKGWEGVEGNDAIAQAVVEAYRDHPAVIAWYLNDELPHRLVPQLEDYYNRVKEADPGRPCFIVLCNRSELPYFPTTTDILGVDPYPVPKDPLVRVSQFTEAGRVAMGGTKPIWQVVQAFAWYQYQSENKDRGHTPTEEELRTGRAPTFEEERCMTYLALTHGAKGLLYYCYYDLRVLPQYEEMWGWMKKIGEEVKTLSPMLLSPDDRGTVAFEPKDSPLHTKLKAHDGRLYLMAVNAEREPLEIAFTLPVKPSGEVAVMFEDRTLTAEGRVLKDTFKPLEVHVYDLGPGK